ncbi:multiple organellar RNA editing factor 8, chloroplastic/mitochondrial-like [Bidens hawaiensis]|uniref:multiple organellar RNA editing factor 8, chloroplastic/mitochondrial-like n=1 Tax=Bidens hawaiensis TaxID=980011 RepID=UPI00404AB946
MALLLLWKKSVPVTVPLLLLRGGLLPRISQSKDYSSSSDDVKELFEEWIIEKDKVYETLEDKKSSPDEEMILEDGCDYEHWFVVVGKPQGTRDEIIHSYIKILEKVVGSYDEARMKIYSVSTRCYYAFGALVSKEDSYKLRDCPGVLAVLPDRYIDAKNKDYGGEPFIDGKAVPYDPKYHKKWNTLAETIARTR